MLTFARVKATDRKVDGIKRLREEFKWSLLEAKNIAELEVISNDTIRAKLGKVDDVSDYVVRKTVELMQKEGYVYTTLGTHDQIVAGTMEEQIIRLIGTALRDGKITTAHRLVDAFAELAHGWHAPTG